MENNSKLSNYSGPAEPSPKARIGNVSDGPRSPDDAYAWSWVDTKKKARKPKRQPKKYVGVKSSGISVDVDGKKAEIKPKKYVSVNKNGFTVDADGNCDKATEEPKRVDKDGISIDEDGFWNDFNERRSFTTKTPPKKSKAEKRKEKKDRLKNIEDFPVFVPQKEDKEFVMKEEEFPTLEIAKTVKKTQVKKKESAPKGPHKERSGVPEETKKGKKVMKKKTDGIKKEDEKKKSLSADDWLLFQELDNIEKANAHEISSHFEENLLRRTLMEELNSMALVAKKNKDLIVEAEALIARKMNRSFKKARRSERLEDLKKTVKSQSHKKLKFLFVGMKDSHIMKIFVQTDELLKAEAAKIKGLKGGAGSRGKMMMEAARKKNEAKKKEAADAAKKDGALVKDQADFTPQSPATSVASSIRGIPGSDVGDYASVNSPLHYTDEEYIDMLAGNFKFSNAKYECSMICCLFSLLQIDELRNMIIRKRNENEFLRTLFNVILTENKGEGRFLKKVNELMYQDYNENLEMDAVEFMIKLLNWLYKSLPEVQQDSFLNLFGINGNGTYSCYRCGEEKDSKLPTFYLIEYCRSEKKTPISIQKLISERIEEEDWLQCNSCGAPVQPTAHLKLPRYINFVVDRVGQHGQKVHQRFQVEEEIKVFKD